MDAFSVYKDIQTRTNGQFLIGVVGPVRTGKSTFIRRFMEVLALPELPPEQQAEVRDALPLSGSGKLITTVEPKFIPKDALKLTLGEGEPVQLRLIDCVGFLIPDAVGNMEEDRERMVRTPWFEQEIPFHQAAELGTRKVISDHSTIGLVVTSDGSFGELPRENFVEAEERTVQELKNQGKPFLVLLNSQKPYREETQKLARELEQKYQVSVMPVNCDQIRREDIVHILEKVLYEFPLRQIEFYIPKWVELLPDIREQFYYDMVSEMTGVEIQDEYGLMQTLKELSRMKEEYVKVQDAMVSVRGCGYGVVIPKKEEITLDEPVVIKQGSKFGVKIRSTSPSIHMIKANIETEIAPIVGSEQQAKDLIAFIRESAKQEDGIWKTNIFGKSIEQLVEDGIRTKIAQITEDSQAKLQDSMQKIVNDSKGGMICIII